MLNEGKICDKNPKLAFAWALKSAKQGFGEAELFVGACCESGIGTEKNADEAQKWYARAAKQGFEAKGSLFERSQQGAAPAPADQSAAQPAAQPQAARPETAPASPAPVQNGQTAAPQGQEGSYGTNMPDPGEAPQPAPAAQAPASAPSPQPVPLTDGQAQ